MKTLDLKKGFQGQVTALDSIVDAVVNDDGLQPSLHLDFEAVGQLAYAEQNGQRQYQRTMQLLDAVCARDSRATNIEWDFSNGGVVGALTEVGKNGLRWNSVAGLFQEASSTNQIRNPRCEGAVAGTPGTAPTNVFVNANGTTSSIVGSGYENGWPYFDLRLSGTPTGNPQVRLEGAGVIAAASGQTWTESIGSRVVSGSLTNVTGVSLLLIEQTGAGGFVESKSSATFEVDSSHRRFFFTATLDGGATVGAIRPSFNVVWAGSGAIDITLRIYAPQLEQGSAPTSPILPPIGSPGSSTRATETVTSLASVTRNSRKSNAGEWDFTNGGSVGAYREYLPNVPAVTGKGLLVEEASTNQIRNPRFEGGDGALPTHWNFASAGVSWTFANGYQNGWPFQTVTGSGTGTGSPVLRFDGLTDIIAGNAQTWTGSVGVRLRSGSLPPTFNLVIVFRDASGSSLQAESVSIVNDVDATHRRFFITATAANASIARVTFEIQQGNLNGVGVDYAVDYYAPQLEQKAYPTSPILPPKGAPGAATRAADVVTVSPGDWGNANGAFSVYLEATAAPEDAAFPALMTLYDASGDFVRVNKNNAGTTAYYWDGSSDGATLNYAQTLFAEGSTVKTAAAFGPNDAAYVFAGGTTAADTSFDPAGVDARTLGLGLNQSLVQQSRTYIKQLRYFPRRLTNAELETLVGN
jgi:hypothetical protein